MDASFDPDRFLTAQADTYAQAVAQLRAGRKRSHWMWFIFPQISGLGLSAMSQRYAIEGLEQARAYLAHPVLGERLRECARVVADSPVESAVELFGDIDAMKLRSSMTLFAAAARAGGASGDPVFDAVLQRYFGGIADTETTARI